MPFMTRSRALPACDTCLPATNKGQFSPQKVMRAPREKLASLWRPAARALPTSSPASPTQKWILSRWSASPARYAALLIGTDAFQETDVFGMTLSHHQVEPSGKTIQEIPAAIAEGFYWAERGRPGPVMVDIPTDILKAMMEFTGPVKFTPRPRLWTTLH